jgi:hypothetical protein
MLDALGAKNADYAAVTTGNVREDIASLAREHATLCLRIIAGNQHMDPEAVMLAAGHVRGIANAIRKGIENTKMMDIPEGKDDEARQGLADVVKPLRALFPELESEA